jgi:hypothetical protein
MSLFPYGFRRRVRVAQFAEEAKMRTLIFAVWPLSFVLAFVGLVRTPDPNLQIGDIVAEQASFCDFFVVKVKDRYVYLNNEDGWFAVVASGSEVTGDLFTMGLKDVNVDGRAKLHVRVLGWDTDWERARTRFAEECDPSAPVQDLLSEQPPEAKLALH